MKRATIGILAHVDAGKTTLTEAILYKTGVTRSFGRVDKGNAFLDTELMERQRGITIYSKQAVFNYKDWEVTLIDTPGHADFSGETERVLPVLDAAILLINAADGVQTQTAVLWKLLEYYDVPVFIFINKMDQGYDENEVLEKIKRLSNNICLSDDIESIAACSEYALEEYLNTDCLDTETIRNMINNREVFLCSSGSALKNTGVDELLDMVFSNMPEYEYESNDSFSGRVFKISRDDGGVRLTHIKVLAGSLKSRDVLPSGEKINQIRLYNGAKYTQLQEVSAGQVCAITGPINTFAGQGFGLEVTYADTVIKAYDIYYIKFLTPVNPRQIYPEFLKLSEEDPLLQVIYDDVYDAISINLLGEVQIEIIKSVIKSRMNLEVELIGRIEFYKINAPELAIELEEEIEEEPEEEDRSYITGVISTAIDTDEVDKILKRASMSNSGKNPKKRKPTIKKTSGEYVYREAKPVKTKEKYTLIDGYNLIFAWPKLNDLMHDNPDAARLALQDILVNYAGFKHKNIIIVYDAYRVKNHNVTYEEYGNLQLVFTKEAQTADSYIQQYAHEHNNYDVTVVTSDGIEQLIIRGAGAALLSSREFIIEVEAAKEEISQVLKKML